MHDIMQSSPQQGYILCFKRSKNKSPAILPAVAESWSADFHFSVLVFPGNWGKMGNMLFWAALTLWEAA